MCASCIRSICSTPRTRPIRRGTHQQSGTTPRDVVASAATPGLISCHGGWRAAGLGRSARRHGRLAPRRRSAAHSPTRGSRSTTRRSSTTAPAARCDPPSRRLLGSRAADATLVELVALRAERAFAARLAQGFAIDPAAARFVELAQLRAPRRDRHGRRPRRIRCGAAARRPARLLRRDRHGRRRRRRRAGAGVVRARAGASRAAARREGRSRRRAGDRRCRPFAPRARRVLRTVAVGAPAHVALEADAAVASLDGLTLDAVDALLGIAARRSGVSTHSIAGRGTDDRRRRWTERRARVRKRVGRVRGAAQPRGGVRPQPPRPTAREGRRVRRRW